jgi:hypothetical protein
VAVKQEAVIAMLSRPRTRWVDEVASASVGSGTISEAEPGRFYRMATERA